MHKLLYFLVYPHFYIHLRYADEFNLADSTHLNARKPDIVTLFQARNIIKNSADDDVFFETFLG